MPGPDQHAAFARDERKDVARRNDIIGTLGWIDSGGNGAGAIIRRNAGGYAFARLDRLREGGGAGVSAAGLRLQSEIVGAALRQRQADQAAAVLGHEIDGIRRCHLRRDHQIALVLAVFSVDEHDHAAVLHLVDDLGDRSESRDGHGHCLGSFDVGQALAHGRNSKRRAT